MSFTCGKFDADLFAMANKTEFEENEAYELDTTERYTPDDEHKITLDNTPVTGTVFISGMEQGEEAKVDEDGTIYYTVSEKVITFPADVTIDFVDVIYKYVKTVNEAIITNKEAAIGECSCIWPVKLRGVAA